MQSRRQLAGACWALFVALVLVAAPHAAGAQSHSVPVSSNRSNTAAAAEAWFAPLAAVSAEQGKRALSFGTVFAFLAIGIAITPALLLRVRAGTPVGCFRANAGRYYRGRAPPFARA